MFSLKITEKCWLVRAKPLDDADLEYLEEKCDQKLKLNSLLVAEENRHIYSKRDDNPISSVESSNSDSDPSVVGSLFDPNDPNNQFDDSDSINRSIGASDDDVDMEEDQ